MISPPEFVTVIALANVRQGEGTVQGFASFPWIETAERVF